MQNRALSIYQCAHGKIISYSCELIRFWHHGRGLSTGKFGSFVSNEINKKVYLSKQMHFHHIFVGKKRKNPTNEEKTARLKDAWDSITGQLYKEAIRRSAPLTTKCIKCNNDCENIIFCEQCGPSNFMCPNCTKSTHEYIWFHHPKMWTVGLFYFIY